MREGHHNGIRKIEKFWFLAGFLAVLAMGLPYLLLGEDAVFVYHDQLDGEVIAYLLQARHLFEKGGLPEFLSGSAKTALIPPAPACVLLFCLLPSWSALAWMQTAGSLTGYAGMFLLLRTIALSGKAAPQDALQENMWENMWDKKGSIAFVAMLAGVLYAYLPFLPVYGLSQYGLPLLLWCILMTREGSFGKTAVFYAAFYAVNSSLVLAGFGVLGAMALAGLLKLAGRSVRKEKLFLSQDKGVFAVWMTMLVIYLLENGTLLQQLLGWGAASPVSHKTEYVLSPVPFWNGFWKNLTAGGQHSNDFHGIFLVGILFVLFVGWVRRERGVLFTVLVRTCLWNMFFAAVAALWDCEGGVAVRSFLGALGAFQMNRLLWLSPSLWYLALGCAVLLALSWCVAGWRRKVIPLACLLVLSILTCMTGVKILLESNLKPNIQKLRNPDYQAMSFRDYYAIGVLEQVQQFIRETTGEEPEAYRVASLGIDPAAALYHGFYCLDGYSNNYSLDYKHSFRQIIAPELSKSAYLAQGFDTWGNRCYLFSAECPGYYTVEKGGFYFRDYEMDTDSFCRLGGRYVLSAAYIQNAEDTGLTLVRREPFETADSYYRIYLYEVSM